MENQSENVKFIDKDERLLAAKFLTLLNQCQISMVKGTSPNLSKMFDRACAEITMSRYLTGRNYAKPEDKLKGWIEVLDKGDSYWYEIWNSVRYQFEEIQEIDAIHEYQMSVGC